MKKGLQILISISASVLVILFVMVLLMFFSTTVKTKIKTYEKVKSDLPLSQNVMPDLKMLPSHEDFFYQYRHKNALFFSSHSILVVVTYNEQTFQSEKKKIEQQFKFKTVNMEDYYASNPEIAAGMIPDSLPLSEFYLGDFYFKVLKTTDKTDSQPPNCMSMIAVSNHQKSIAYLYLEGYQSSIFGNITNMYYFIDAYYKYDW